MIDIKELLNEYPESLKSDNFLRSLILKEYIQYQMLDILFNSVYKEKISFIGGTCLRIVYNNQRFSEDLDFDNFGLTEEEFVAMTDKLAMELEKLGYRVKLDDKGKDKRLNAFRRNITFPGLLYEQKISGHKEQKFLIKVESQAHNFAYAPEKKLINKFNFYTIISCTPLSILLSMKICTIFNRKKGRDFYDLLFLAKKAKPDYSYINHKLGINSPGEVEKLFMEECKKVDFRLKQKDVEKFLFNKSETNWILNFLYIIEQSDLFTEVDQNMD